MPEDYDYIAALDSTVNRAITISEQSEQLFLIAIDFIKSRRLWDVTDAEWDTVEGWIGDGITQILTPTTGGGMSIESKDVERGSDFAISGAQTSYPVDWDVGDYDAVDNSKVYVANTGRFILTLNIDINSNNGNRCEPEIWVNGVIVAGIIQSAGTNRSYSLAVTLDLVAGDYVQLKVSTNGNVTIAQDVYPTKMNLTGFY